MAFALLGRGLLGARNPHGFGLTGASNHAGAPERLGSTRYRSLLDVSRGGGTRHRHSAGLRGARNGVPEKSLVHGTIPRTAEDFYSDYTSAHGHTYSHATIALRGPAQHHATTSIAATRTSTRPLPSQPRAPARDHFNRSHARQHTTTSIAATRASTRPLPLG